MAKDRSKTNQKTISIIGSSKRYEETDKLHTENARIHIIEVAILEFKGDKIKSLREYWHSERL